MSSKRGAASHTTPLPAPLAADPLFFHTPAEAAADRQKRLRELDVLQAELGSLKPGARVFQGGPGTGTVYLQAADVAAVKAGVKKERDALSKAEASMSKGRDGSQLNF